MQLSSNVLLLRQVELKIKQLEKDVKYCCSLNVKISLIRPNISLCSKICRNCKLLEVYFLIALERSLKQLL